MTSETVLPMNILTDINGKPLPIDLQPIENGPIRFGGTVYTVTTDEITITVQLEDDQWYSPDYQVSSDNLVDVLVECTIIADDFEWAVDPWHKHGYHYSETECMDYDWSVARRASSATTWEEDEQERFDNIRIREAVILDMINTKTARQLAEIIYDYENPELPF